MSEDLALSKEGQLPENLEDMQLPVYHWQTGKEFYLSKLEKYLADTFVERCSWEECMKVAKVHLKKELNPQQVRKVLQRPHVWDYLQKKYATKAKWEGITLEEMGVELFEKGKSMTSEELMAKKIVAQMKGFLQGAQSAVNQNNIQINFTQGDGTV